MLRVKQCIAVVAALMVLLLPGLSQKAWAEPPAPSSTGGGFPAVPTHTLPGAPTPTTRTLPGTPSSTADPTITATVSGSEPAQKANLPGITDPRWKQLPPDQQKVILGKAKNAAGLAVCSQIPGVNKIDKLKKGCASRIIGPLFTASKVAVGVTVCAPITALMPPGLGLIARFDCAKVMVGLIEGKGWEAFNGTVLGELGKVAQKVGAVLKFIANPTSAIDELANATKDTAVGLSKGVLENAARSNSESLGSAQFRSDYAAGAGLGMVVAAIMLLITFWQASRGSIDPDTLIESLIVRAPFGILMILMGPAIGYVLQQAVNGISEGIASAAGTTMGEVLAKLVAILTAATVSQVPGGALAGIVLFIVMIVGAFTVLVTTVMLDFGFYMTSAILSVVFAMRINPLWRPKVRKIEAGWGAMLLMKPLFMLLLWLAFGFLKAKLGVTGAGVSGMPLAITIVTVAAVMIAVGFAPFALMKYAPILPGGNEMSESSSSGSGAMMAGAMGGLMSQIAMQRSSAGQAAGRSGPVGQTGPPGQTGTARPMTTVPTPSAKTAAGPSDGPAQPPQRIPQPSVGRGGPPSTSGMAGTSGAAGKSGVSAGTKGAAAAGGPAVLAAALAMQGAQGMQALRAKGDQLARVGAPKMGEAEGE